MMRWHVGAAAVWVAALGIVPGPARGDEAQDLARQARKVLKQYCSRCHHGEGSEGGEFDVVKQPDLLSDQFWDPSLVVPGKPEGSYLLERVVKSQMPPRNIQERPGATEKDVLRRWIAAGAPSFPNDSAERPFVTLAGVLTAVRDHLRDAEPADRPYLRFFTLHTLANSPTVSDDDLRLARAAFSKAINSLSRKARIVVPEAIGPARTILVVDLRDLGWDRGRRWLAIERAYPYGVRYDDLPDKALRAIDRELAE
jgi:hypothetical protein